MPTWFFVTLEFSIIATALVAGVFLTFSDFVMRSLDASGPTAGIEVMQIINREVYATLFMALFLGMSALSPVLIGYAVLKLSGPASVLVLAGAAIYLAGVFGVTIAFNVPMNRRLDTLVSTGADAASYWANYVPVWSRWNHIRAISASVSAICFLAAGGWLVQGSLAPG